MNLSLLAPEIFLSLAALGLLGLESFVHLGRRLWIGLAGFAVLVTAYMVVGGMGTEGTAMGMLAADGLGQFFKLVMLAGVLLVLWMSADYRSFNDQTPWAAYCALLLLSTVGLLLLVSSLDFLMIVISLELISITSFILTGFLFRDRRSSEAAIKFFLVGAFSSGLMIYGISLFYGLTGSTSLSALADGGLASSAHPLPLVGALFFILAGLGFKLAMAPFHMWVPDAYEGAPTPITAYLSVGSKAAAFGILVRALPNHASFHISTVLAVLAGVTMTVGNFSALRQTNVKRLLAYSSIAQMGYVLVGFVAAGKLGLGSVLAYTLAYLFMNLGAFACVIAVTNEAGTDEIDGFSGLAQRSFPLALVTTVFLLSLTGIPPLIGFVGKFAIFAAAISEGWVWLAVVGVLNSVVSLYYYFSLVHRMFFSAPQREGKVSLTPALAGCVAVTLFVTLAAGLFPNKLFLWIQGVVR